MENAISHPAIGSDVTRSAAPVRSWNDLFSAYRNAFGRSANGQNLVLPFTGASFADITEEVVRVGRNAAPGDGLVLDVRVNQNERKHARERLAEVLFRAGYEGAVIWASRDLLVRESQRRGILARLLPNSALGLPSAFGIAEVRKIAGEKKRLVAIATRAPRALPDSRDWKLSVVLPAYNEAGTIETVLDQILAKKIPGMTIELCIVESNSKDGTRDKVLAYQSNPQVKVLLEERPSGKGHAVRAGLEMATGDIVLIQDADLEYDINDYEKLVTPLRAYQASFVLGSRHAGEKSDWQIRSFEGQQSLANVLNAGHIFFTWFLNVLFRQKLRDPFTMFKVFRRDAIFNVDFQCNRFDFDHELVGKLVRVGRKPVEIDVKYVSRSFREGKKVSFFRDPPTWLKACLKHRFSRLYKIPDAG